MTQTIPPSRSSDRFTAARLRLRRGMRGGRPRGDGDDPYEQIRKSRQKSRAGGHATLGEYPLGALLARGIIDPAMHEAGCFYALHYARAVGRTRFSAASLYAQLAGEALPGGGDQRDDGRSQDLYRAGKAALAEAGREAARMTDAVCVFGQWPDFLMGTQMSLAAAERSHTDIASLRAGLRGLVKLYRTGTRRPLPIQAAYFPRHPSRPA